jgi:hypothetical protein
VAKKRQIKKISSIFKIFIVISAIILISIPAVIIIVFENVNEIRCANSISCIKDLTGLPEQEFKKAEFMGEVIDVPEIETLELAETEVLGEQSDVNKRIFINLTNQTLYAVENHDVVHTFLISSGKWGRTPTGNFRIWIKLNSTRMSGGNQELGTYYNLPNVPWTMYFYNEDYPKHQGFGIHGAYWHNNFGNPMSHGCINMKIEEAKILFDWAMPVSSGFSTYSSDENPGTRIIIYGKARDY